MAGPGGLIGGSQREGPALRPGAAGAEPHPRAAAHALARMLPARQRPPGRPYGATVNSNDASASTSPEEETPWTTKRWVPAG